MATTRRRTRDRPRAWTPEAPTRPPAAAGYPQPEPPRPPYDWHSEVRSWSGLNFLAGIWLIISPFVLDYSARDATWNPIVFGAIVCALALVRFAGAFRASVLSWINMGIGVWLFISAWWLADTMRASWNVGVMGVIVFVLAAASATTTEDALRARRI